jgi:hypothetical protein
MQHALRVGVFPWLLVLAVPVFFVLAPLSFGVVACSSEASKPVSRVAPPEVFNDSFTPVGADAVDTSRFQMAFVSPKGDATPINSSGLKIVVQAQNASPTATWSLYYSKVLRSVADLRPIVEGLPISVTEIDWNTADLASGTYYLVAEGILEEQRSLHWLGSKIEMSAGSQGNGPQVVVGPDVSGRVFYPGQTLSLSFNALSKASSAAVFKLLLSADGGKTWQPVAEDIESSSHEINFDNTFQQSARYKVKVEATVDGQTGAAESSGVFGFASAPVTWRQNLVNGLIKTKCQSCHEVPTVGSSMPPGGGFVVTSWDDVSNSLGSFIGVNSKKGSIFNRTRLGAAAPMPPSSSGLLLTDEERDLLAFWAWGQYQR